jgi:4-diphosphocytidyl-2-C-methyl-D-erythritol kinase
VICFPNCKINVGLYVTEKRQDGFHSIESVFVPIPLHDVLEVVPSVNGEFDLKVTGGSEIIDRDNNICWKALSLLRADFELDPVTLFLHKIIPSGAGLGGGSADGAFTLKLLSAFYGLDLSIDLLKEYASRLGSDCPFFIENKIQFVSGRGEVMENVDLDLKGITIVVVYPSIHISTKEAYSLISPKQAVFDLRKLSGIPRHEWKKCVHNDFEMPVVSRYPEIQSIKENLYNRGAFYASMSGSGSSVYGLFEHDVNIEAVFEPHFTWTGTL